MPVEQLTYAQLAERLKVSSEAARALVKRYRWPRSRGNDGKTLVAVDLDEIRHTPLPARSPGGHRPDVAALQARIASLEAELARPRATATGDQPATARTIAALEGYVETLKVANTHMEAALAKLETEAARERARAEGLNEDLDVAWRELALARVEAATVPALRAVIEAVKDERDHLLTREHLREQRRWYRRLVGG